MRSKSWTVLALIALIAPVATARSQAAAPMPVRVSVGPFVGMNYTTVSGPDVEDTDSKWGFSFGGQLDVNFASVGLFRTGLIYAQRGAQGTDQGVNIKIKLNYLELPLLIGYRFPATGLRPYVVGGAHVGFKTGCEFEASQGGQSFSSDCDNPDLDIGDFSDTDFALEGGGGLILPVGRNDLTFDVRYVAGLKNIEKSSEVKNRGWTFGVSLMVPLAR